MKKLLHALAMAFSMFCAVPCPFRIWDEAARPLMTLCLPAVGALIGALWALALVVLRALAAPAVLCGAVLAVLPLALSGFMHMDGFLDVCDALGSCRSVEERRRILKDPHAGSFAVVSCAVYLLLFFGVCASLRSETPAAALLPIPIASRCCSSFFVSVLPAMSTSQYAGRFREGAGMIRLLVPVSILLAVSCAAFILWGRAGFAPVAVTAGYCLALRRGYRGLGGMNGDIAGYSLTIAELCGAAALVLLG